MWIVLINKPRTIAFKYFTTKQTTWVAEIFSVWGKHLFWWFIFYSLNPWVEQIFLNRFWGTQQKLLVSYLIGTGNHLSPLKLRADWDSGVLKRMNRKRKYLTRVGYSMFTSLSLSLNCSHFRLYISDLKQY